MERSGSPINDYSYFLAQNLYSIILIPILLLSLWAQLRVSSSFHCYSGVCCCHDITGAQAAEAILHAHGIWDVAIRPVQGNLTDHYDPREHCIYLSERVYAAGTVAAVGVAAHEAGHAVQYAVGYGPVRLRSAIVSVTNLSSQASMILLFLGLFLYSQSLFAVGILLFSVTTIFQLVTLPVEFNASRRAMETIESLCLLTEEEACGAERVLRAAAMTYVAALLTSILQLLRFLIIFLGRSGDSNRRGGRR